MSVLLPLQPGSVGTQCFRTEQERLVGFAAELWAVLDGTAFYNIGPDKPDPAFNSYPWFNTTLGIWFTYSGGWRAPNPEQSQYARRLWMGNATTDLEVYDGGSAGTSGPTSGPMWEVDHLFDDKFPVGPGTFPNGTVVAVGGQGGFDEVTLTDAQVPDTAVVPLDGLGAVVANPRVQKSGTVTALSSINGDFTGTDSGGQMTDVLLKVNGGGTAHNNLPPYRGIYIIKRVMARTYYFIP